MNVSSTTRRRAASPPWNHDDAATPSNRHWRDAEPVRRRWDDGQWGQSREPDRWNGRRGDYPPSALLRDDLLDETLFPPAPSRPADGGEARSAQVEEDPERAAFEQELERLASQLHKVLATVDHAHCCSEQVRLHHCIT